MPTSRRLASVLAIALAVASGACGKRYTEIEVRDSGRVAVGMWGGRGALTALPADGSQRIAPLPVPGVAAMRRGREIAIGWQGGAPVTLIDERGVLPRLASNPGVEVHDGMLWAAYNVTPTRVLPQHTPTDDAVPVLLSTDLPNLVDAREVREVRHWPGYVCVSLGAVLAAAGTAFLATRDPDNSSSETGVLYIIASVPLLVYGVINLTSSTEIKPLYIPGGPPR